MDDDDGAGENAKKTKIVLTSVDWRRMADQHTMPPLIDTEQTLMQRYIKQFYFQKTNCVYLENKK